MIQGLNGEGPLLTTRSLQATLARRIEIRKYRYANGTVPFDRWFARLRDGRAQTRVLVQLDRLKLGLPGDWKSVGEGVFELRIFEGKGYRVYFAHAGKSVVILLCGGR